MRATLISLWLVTGACSNEHRTPSTSGSGGSAAGSALAIVAAPQTLDAPPAPAQIGGNCDVGDGYVRCMVVPVGGALPGKHCWRALVAVEHHLDATIEMVTSEVGCTTDLAANAPTLLDLSHTRGLDLEDTCASLDGCMIVLVDQAAVVAETKKLSDQMMAALTTEKTDRQAMLRDDRPIGDADMRKLSARYKKLSENPSATMEYQMRHRGDRDDEFSGLLSSAGELTTGKLTCALAAAGPSSFAACLVDHPMASGSDVTPAVAGSAADAGSPASDARAAVPGAGPRFAFLSERAITPAELGALSTEDLVLARNEVYARHGYAFKHADLAAYFAKQTWYKADPAYDEASLTAIERDNVRTLLATEKSRK